MCALLPSEHLKRTGARTVASKKTILISTHTFQLKGFVLSGKKTSETLLSAKLVVLWGMGVKRTVSLTFRRKNALRYIFSSKAAVRILLRWSQTFHRQKTNLENHRIYTLLKVISFLSWYNHNYRRQPQLSGQWHYPPVSPELLSQHGILQQMAMFQVPNGQLCSTEKWLIMECEHC